MYTLGDSESTISWVKEAVSMNPDDERTVPHCLAEDEIETPTRIVNTVTKANRILKASA